MVIDRTFLVIIFIILFKQFLLYSPSIFYRPPEYVTINKQNSRKYSRLQLARLPKLKAHPIGQPSVSKP